MPYGSGAGSGQGGMAAGRRLASESGGVVGASLVSREPRGSPSLREGPVSSVRHRQTVMPVIGDSGAVPPGTRRPRSREEQENGERPDYLVEDEETWQQGSRRIVPPVID